MIEQPSSKVSVPDAAAQKETEKVVREVFESDFADAKEPDQKSALAKKLLQMGEATHRDLTARFVLCRMAEDIAAEAGDADTAFGAVDAAGEMHQTDGLALSVDVARKVVRATSRSFDPTAVVGRLDGLVDRAIAEDRLDVAQQLCDVMVRAADRTDNVDLKRQAMIRAREAREIDASYGTPRKRALATLTTQPTDAGANLVIGKYRCFVSGNWETGLPMLVVGNDAGLKALAQKELARPTEADNQVEIADQWWDVAASEKGLAAWQIQLHASAWYQKALPEVTELKKAVIEKRLKAMAAAVAEAHPARAAAAKAAAVPKWQLWQWEWKDGLSKRWLIADGTAINVDGATGERSKGTWSRDGDRVTVIFVYTDARHVTTGLISSDGKQMLCEAKQSNGYFTWVKGTLIGTDLDGAEAPPAGP